MIEKRYIESVDKKSKPDDPIIEYANLFMRIYMSFKKNTEN